MAANVGTPSVCVMTRAQKAAAKEDSKEKIESEDEDEEDKKNGESENSDVEDGENTIKMMMIVKMNKGHRRYGMHRMTYHGRRIGRFTMEKAKTRRRQGESKRNLSHRRCGMHRRT